MAVKLKTDKMARFTGIFILVFCIIVVVLYPFLWWIAIGYMAIVVLIAWLKRNSP
jgi:hypothetical protein